MPRPAHVRLARRSLELLAILAPETPPLGLVGGLYVGAASSVDATLSLARRFDVQANAVTGAAGLEAFSPWLGDGPISHGAHVPGDGVLDLHAIIQSLARAARQAGARLCTGTEVAGVTAPRGRADGVRLWDGEKVAAGAVLVAAGAWAAGLGESCGAPLHLVPYRRHLIMLDTRRRTRPGPVVWRVDRGEEAYFRPESGGLLASPCDEEPWPPGTPPRIPTRSSCSGRGSRAWRRRWPRPACTGHGPAFGRWRATANSWWARILGVPVCSGWRRSVAAG